LNILHSRELSTGLETGAVSGKDISCLVLNVKVEALEEGGFLATSPDLPGLVVQGRTQAETIELAQANARILIEVYLSEKLPIRRASGVAFVSFRWNAIVIELVREFAQCSRIYVRAPSPV
jgi:predicted RNase H-like HicB family nuclease